MPLSGASMRCLSFAAMITSLKTPTPNSNSLSNRSKVIQDSQAVERRGRMTHGIDLQHFDQDVQRAQQCADHNAARSGLRRRASPFIVYTCPVIRRAPRCAPLDDPIAHFAGRLDPINAGDQRPADQIIKLRNFRRRFPREQLFGSSGFNGKSLTQSRKVAKNFRGYFARLASWREKSRLIRWSQFSSH